MVARPVIKKIVNTVPLYAYFKPQGIPMTNLEIETLSMEEIEALNLKDVENLDQEVAAKKMGISRSTFQRIVKSARYKLVKSIIEGKALKVEGGNYIPGDKIIEKQCLKGKHHYYVRKDDLVSQEQNYHSISKIKCPECGKRLIDYEKDTYRQDNHCFVSAFNHWHQYRFSSKPGNKGFPDWQKSGHLFLSFQGSEYILCR